MAIREQEAPSPWFVSLSLPFAPWPAGPSPPPSPPGGAYATPSPKCDGGEVAWRSLTARPGAQDAPSAVRASLARLGKRNRRLFDRAAGPLFCATVREANFTLQPISEPYLGAWMTRRAAYQQDDTEALLRRQELVQVLAESRFDALHRLVAFCVLFHAMGKEVQDWWAAVSLGLLGYDMSRTQSIMRVATTASPVSGMEVRERMVAIQEETRRAAAAASVQRIWRAVRLRRWIARNIQGVRVVS